MLITFCTHSGSITSLRLRCETTKTDTFFIVRKEGQSGQVAITVAPKSESGLNFQITERKNKKGKKEKNERERGMGGCLSDLEGGKQAVGGGVHRQQGPFPGAASNISHNDAVDFLYKSQGFHPLSTRVEVYIFLIFFYRIPIFILHYH